MPWSNQSGGGGGWKSGGGGPWGQPPKNGGGSPGNQPDLEEILRRGQDRLRQVLPGGGMGMPFAIVLGLIVLGIVCFYAFTVRVDTDEEGVVLRFGKYVRQLPPGLNFRLPYPIERVYLPKVTRINRIEIGSNSTESLMLTGDENIVDIDFIVLWKIKNAPDFLFKVDDPQSAVRDVAESAMREVVGKSNIEPLLTQDRTQTEKAVLALMQKTLDSYHAGVSIQEVQLQKVDPPEQVIAAFRDVQAAKADQERLQNQAQAYANKVIPEARGKAQQILQQAEGYRSKVVAVAKGEAARFDEVYQQYKLAPDITRKRMYIDTMAEIFGSSNKVLLDEKGVPHVVPYLPLPGLSGKAASSSSSSGGSSSNAETSSNSTSGTSASSTSASSGGDQ